MRRWKAAGPAPKGVDDQLWKRFRGAQDTFFGARDAANAELGRASSPRTPTKKEALLVEAEALLPVTDLQAAKEAFRDIADRWDAAGKVPRDRMKDLEGRMRKVEQAIRGVEDDQWRRSNPEARPGRPTPSPSSRPRSPTSSAKRDKAVAAGNDQEGRRARRRHRGPPVLARPRPARPSTSSPAEPSSRRARSSRSIPPVDASLPRLRPPHSTGSDWRLDLSWVTR